MKLSHLFVAPLIAFGLFGSAIRRFARALAYDVAWADELVLEQNGNSIFY